MISPEQMIRDRNWIDRCIRSCFYGTLALNAAPSPYAVPLCFGLDGDTLYFHGLDSGRKIDLLRADPWVSFLFVQCGQLEREVSPCDWGMGYSSVMGTGTASLLESEEDKRKGLAAILAQYTDQRFHFSGKQLAPTAVIAVRIDEICGKKSV